MEKAKKTLLNGIKMTTSHGDVINLTFFYTKRSIGMYLVLKPDVASLLLTKGYVFRCIHMSPKVINRSFCNFYVGWPLPKEKVIKFGERSELYPGYKKISNFQRICNDFLVDITPKVIFIFILYYIHEFFTVSVGPGQCKDGLHLEKI